MTEMLLNGKNAPNLPSIQIGLSRLSELICVNLFWVHPSKPKFEPSSPNSQLATRDSQLATRDLQLATRTLPCPDTPGIDFVTFEIWVLVLAALLLALMASEWIFVWCIILLNDQRY